MTGDGLPDGLLLHAAVTTARHVLDASQRLDFDAVPPVVLASHLGALQQAVRQLLDAIDPEEARS
jgi:hypothetical protein